MTEQIICCICNKPIPVKVFPNGGTWDGGNNAEPVKGGRCCDDCDYDWVIPARLMAMGYSVEKANDIGDLLKRTKHLVPEQGKQQDDRRPD